MPQARNHYPYLCMMMFMQFAVYGLWLPIAGRFLKADPVTEGGLGFTDAQAGWIIGLAASIGAICSPLITQFADRRFSAQRFLGVLMVAGGIVKLITSTQTSFTMWLILSVAFALLFMPAAAICNAVAMRNLENPARQFPGVRLWSTVGWITVAWFFPLLALKQNVEFQWLPPFFRGDDVEFVAARMIDSVRWSGMLAIVYGLFAFFVLPDTPPSRAAHKKPAALAIAGMLRHRSLRVLLLAALLFSTLHVVYFIQMSSFLKTAGLSDAAIMPAMSIGQACELLTYAVLGRMLATLGFRNVLLIGSSCFIARFLVHGSVDLPVWCQVAGQALHGLCFACFFGSCIIYVDRVAPPDLRSSAQSIFNFVFYGVGPIVAVQLNAWLSARFQGAEGLGIEGYAGFWYSAALIAAIGVVWLAVLFREENPPAAELPLAPDDARVAPSS